MTHLVKRTWAEIDLDAAAHNFQVILKAAAGKPVLAVIKADAYGHGAVQLGRLYRDMGAAGFAVSNLEEGIELRQAGLDLPILILGYTPPEEVADLAKYDLTTALFGAEYAVRLSAEAQQAGVTVSVHIKLDTGMGRIGFDCRSEAAIPASARLAADCATLPGLHATGAFTHFATADRDSDPNAEFTNAQYRRFMAGVEAIRARGVALDFVHCCNSAGTMLHADKHLDGMRAGIILYGLPPNPGLEFMDQFYPVMALKSVVSFVKTLAPGECVSYGRTYTAQESVRVATVPIGYADGYPRIVSNKGQALLHGQRVPIIGRVCMDQLMLDISKLENVQEGDTVTLFGKDGEAQLPVEELSALAGTINYETVCDVARRVPRIYLKHGKPVEICNRIVKKEESTP